MTRLWLALALSALVLLGACTPNPKPTETAWTIVQPGIDAARRGHYGFALFTYGYWRNSTSLWPSTGSHACTSRAWARRRTMPRRPSGTG
jgi:hypothetical protein